MKKLNPKKIILTLIILIAVITVCKNYYYNHLIHLKSGVVNPASAYCGDQGGKLEIVTSTDGSQSGICLFKDGSKCEEWAFFRGECKVGEKH